MPGKSGRGPGFTLSIEIIEDEKAAVELVRFLLYDAEYVSGKRTEGEPCGSSSPGSTDEPRRTTHVA